MEYPKSGDIFLAPRFPAPQYDDNSDRIAAGALQPLLKAVLVHRRSAE